MSRLPLHPAFLALALDRVCTAHEKVMGKPPFCPLSLLRSLDVKVSEFSVMVAKLGSRWSMLLTLVESLLPLGNSLNPSCMLWSLENPTCPLLSLCFVNEVVFGCCRKGFFHLICLLLPLEPHTWKTQFSSMVWTIECGYELLVNCTQRCGWSYHTWSKVLRVFRIQLESWSCRLIRLYIFSLPSFWLSWAQLKFAKMVPSCIISINVHL